MEKKEKEKMTKDDLMTSWPAPQVKRIFLSPKARMIKEKVELIRAELPEVRAPQSTPLRWTTVAAATSLWAWAIYPGSLSTPPSPFGRALPAKSAILFGPEMILSLVKWQQ